MKSREEQPSGTGGGSPSVPPPRLITFRLSLLIAISILVIATGGLIIANSYFRSRRVVHELAGRLFAEVSHRAVTQTRERLMAAAPVLDVLRGARSDHLVAPDREVQARFFLAMLRANPEFSWVSFGDEQGSYTGAYRAGSNETRIHFSVQHDGETDVAEHIVRHDGSWEAQPHEVNHYDPRQRPWYRLAREARHRVWTEPYVFFHSEAPGITCSAPQYASDGSLEGVFAIDFELQSLSDFVRTLQPSAHGQVFVFTQSGTLIAHPTSQIVSRTSGHPDLARMDHVSEGVTRAYFDHVRGRHTDGQFTFDVDGRRYLASFTRFQVDSGVDWVVGAVAPEQDFMGDVQRNNVISLVISLAALAAALMIAAFLAQRIAVPLSRLAAEMEKVGQFRLDDKTEAGSAIREVAMMNRALSSMKNGLRSFARYVPRDLVRMVVASGEAAELGGRIRSLTIYFSDLQGFTSIAETMKPDALVTFLGGYLDAMTRTITAHQGTVDKYIGDGIMAFWGAPGDNADHAVMACEAALACQEKLAEMKRTGDPNLARLKARIGLATGEVLVGNIGTPERMNYTVMGDIANLAARLEGLNKAYHTGLMVSESTYLAAKHQIVARSVDVVAVKGKAQGVRVYELLGRVKDDDGSLRTLADKCGEALDAYLTRDFAKARGLYDVVLTLRPNDPVATVMRARCEHFEANPPPSDWNGVYVATEK